LTFYFNSNINFRWYI